MNYDSDEALRAPVWDELNQDDTQQTKTNKKDMPETSNLNQGFNLGTDSNITNELSQTFANISTNDNTNITIDKDYTSDQGENEDKLMNMLAPEDNPLAGLERDNDTNFGMSTSSTANINDPLFGMGSGSILSDDALKLTSNGSPTKRANKPHSLFNASTRLRRRKPNYGNLKKTENRSNDKNGKNDTIPNTSEDDPLGKAQKENELVDESLDYENDKKIGTRNDNSKSSLINQMNEPLYHLSPKKNQTVTASRNANVVNTSNQHADSRATSEEPDTFATAAANIVPFSIDVTDPIKVGDLTSAHVEYSVNSASELLDPKQAQVTRRYTDFRWLYRQLQSNHWGKVIPPPPEKQAVGRFKRDFIENRRVQMETMLKRISNDPVLQNDKDFLMFLTSEQFSNDSKLRAHITASGAYNDNNDLSEIHISEVELLGADDAVEVLRNGGLDAEQNKGFMSFSLSSQPKYNEPDQFFLKERERFIILEEQLKQLYKSLEMIDTERNELASSVFEFSKAIESLAKLEVTKKSTDILYAFAQLHNSIRESLERNSLQQSLTLGITLDEYIRTLSSIKAILNQRAKLGYFLVIVENDLNKKKSQFAKTYPDYKPSVQINDERCKNMLMECLILDKRCNVIKEKWLKIADDIKLEIKRQEIDKIEEFRNSMEISLESLIESQKECIELWETFYQNYL
ncbi:Vacuolar protein sorting-associated protein 5 [Maudiozyma exigua]|uniref:Vacuolar protein sorting-associated protein 5 n=1 Tax=Maudiozyma exigua TaxID=34358 RepID=A0A9P6WF26_MAUEX|nr:Vacuolar protein sorting-associated protein 5 [Kazachstania exigua]